MVASHTHARTHTRDACYCLSELVLSVLSSLCGEKRWVGEFGWEKDEEKEAVCRLRCCLNSAVRK